VRCRMPFLHDMLESTRRTRRAASSAGESVAYPRGYRQRHQACRPRVSELEDRTMLSHGAVGMESAAIVGRQRTHGTAVTVGALGDSYTDEYRFYPPDRSRARNWIEILAANRGIRFGPFTTKSRGSPRNQGFAFNWAL